MPKAAPAAGAGIPVSGDHSNSTELSAPVTELDDATTPITDDLSQLGSHRDDAPESEVAETEEPAGEEEVAAPARLKGKSLAQVYQEFAGLEKEYSRQGNELGEARKLVRDFLEQAVTPRAKEQEQPDPTDDDFALNPKASAERLLEKKLKPLQEALTVADQRALIADFNSRHPGFFQTAETADFQDWVKASPYRTRLFLAAGRYDMAAAEDLHTAWEEHAAATTPAPEVAEEKAQQKRAAVKRVTTETGGAGKQTGGKSGKPIYKLSELTRLYNTDRDRYNDMADDIRSAFAEGRVR